MFKTSAIILRTVPYGETSLVVTAFTALFGVQSYMVNGVRTSKKGGSKANLYEPGNIVELEVYHNNKHTLQRIKECTWKHLNTNSTVIKNSIALFFVEILNKLLKQPEENIELYEFCEDILLQLSAANTTIAANMPLFFCLHVSAFFGFKIEDEFTDEENIVDMAAGKFCNNIPQHEYYLQDEYAQIVSTILRCQIPDELAVLHLNQQKRRLLLHSFMDYFMLHVPDFVQPKSLKVLEAVLDE
jgi:DNA repair protein RecO (recombination protein O)